MTDLFIETTGTHQFLDPSSSHPDHCKKEITYSKALRLNRICFGNGTFDKRSNDLERRLLETGYNKKITRKQVIRIREHSGKQLSDKKKIETSEQKLMFNISYYPIFQTIKNILQKLVIST